MQSYDGGEQGYSIATGGQVPDVEKFYPMLRSFSEFLSQRELSQSSNGLWQY